MTTNWTIPEILEELKEIDANDDVTATSWEADFLDSIFRQLEANNCVYLSPKQRVACMEIIQRYGEE